MEGAVIIQFSGIPCWCDGMTVDRSAEGADWRLFKYQRIQTFTTA